MESGAHGDLGLSKAHVAAEHAVHGFFAREVLGDFNVGGCLVLGIGEGERPDHVRHHALVSVPGLALVQSPLGLHFEQFSG